MTVCWEAAAAKKVLMYTIHTEVTTMAWAYGLRNLIVPGQVVGLAGMPYDHARNEAVAMMLRDGYEWLFSLDSDVIPPRDAILRLLDKKLPVVSGLYCRRSPPHGVPVAIKNGRWLDDYRPGDLVEVDLVGAGCLLTHRSVYEKVPPQRPESGKPWYDWRVDMKSFSPNVIVNGQAHYINNDRPPLSEDFTLCAWWRKHGIKVMLATDVVCRHVGFSQVLPGVMSPLETATIT